MAGNMESMLLDASDSSSDDSDNGDLEEVTTGTAAAAAAAVTVAPPVVTTTAPTTNNSSMSQADLKLRLKSLYSQNAASSKGTAGSSSSSATPTSTSATAAAAASPRTTGTSTPAATAPPPSSQPPPQRRMAVVNHVTTMRPLQPNRPSTQPPSQQQQQPTQKTSDPFEPTPLRAMIRPPNSSSSQATKPQPQQPQQPPPPSTQPPQRTSSSGSSTPTVRHSNTSLAPSQPPSSQQKSSQQQQQQLAQEAKARKEQFLMFTRVLMKYLEQKDPPMHARAKAVIRECAEKNKTKVKGYESVTLSMQTRLRQTVGDTYWRRADDYLKHFIKQKKKLQDSKQQQRPPQSSQAPPAPQQRTASGQTTTSSNSTTSSQQPRPLPSQVPRPRPDHKPPVIIQKRPRPAVASTDVGNERKRPKPQPAPQALKPSQQASLEQLQRDTQAKINSLSTTASTTLSSAAKRKKTSSESPKPLQQSQPPPQQPLREYHDLMEMVHHAVTYDWTNAGLLLGKSDKQDVSLADEQRQLLYRPPKVEPSVLETQFPRRGWDQQNVVSARAAWARIRLPEQRRALQQARESQKATSSSNAAADPKKKPVVVVPKWRNEDWAAAQDQTLAVLSEGAQSYLKTILAKALVNARARENLDGVRLWHQQHGPQRPPLSLRLGCDVARQVAQSQGNACKTYQRMEQALARQQQEEEDDNKEDGKSFSLEDTTLWERSSSMADVACRPSLKNAVQEADLNAKRHFEVYGGKGGGGPPLGRVPQHPTLVLRDVALATTESSSSHFFGHQRNGLGSSHYFG